MCRCQAQQEERRRGRSNPPSPKSPFRVAKCHKIAAVSTTASGRTDASPNPCSPRTKTDRESRGRMDSPGRLFVVQPKTESPPTSPRVFFSFSSKTDSQFSTARASPPPSQAHRNRPHLPSYRSCSIGNEHHPNTCNHVYKYHASFSGVARTDALRCAAVLLFQLSTEHDATGQLWGPVLRPAHQCQIETGPSPYLTVSHHLISWSAHKPGVARLNNTDAYQHTPKFMTTTHQ